MLGSLLLRGQIALAQKTKPEIVQALPHDTKAYTQGLVVAGDALFESTGLVGQSSLRRLSMQTGEVLERHAMPADEFAEDIAIIGQTLFQLGYQNQKAYTYRTKPFERISEHTIAQEGWGLTSWHDTLIASDGSHRLRRYRPDFLLISTHEVRASGLPLRRLNAMTTRGDFVYANIWYTAMIAEIRLRDFKLNRIIDCSALVAVEQPATVHHVMNGIAWDAGQDLFWATGKNWKTLFSMRIPAP